MNNNELLTFNELERKVVKLMDDKPEACFDLFNDEGIRDKHYNWLNPIKSAEAVDEARLAVQHDMDEYNNDEDVYMDMVHAIQNTWDDEWLLLNRGQSYKPFKAYQLHELIEALEDYEEE